MPDLETRFALDLSKDGISLFHNLKEQDWRLKHRAPMVLGVLGEQMKSLHSAAKSLGMEGSRVQVWLPKEQVLTLDVDLSADTDSGREQAILDAFAAETGEDPATFFYDVGETKATGLSAVAAVPIATLEETDAFLRDNGFAPVLYSTRTKIAKFGAAPVFGYSGATPVRSPRPSWALPLAVGFAGLLLLSGGGWLFSTLMRGDDGLDLPAEIAELAPGLSLSGTAIEAAVGPVAGPRAVPPVPPRPLGRLAQSADAPAPVRPAEGAPVFRVLVAAPADDAPTPDAGPAAIPASQPQPTRVAAIMPLATEDLPAVAKAALTSPIYMKAPVISRPDPGAGTSEVALSTVTDRAFRRQPPRPAVVGTPDSLAPRWLVPPQIAALAEAPWPSGAQASNAPVAAGPFVLANLGGPGEVVPAAFAARPAATGSEWLAAARSRDFSSNRERGGGALLPEAGDPVAAVTTRPDRPDAVAAVLDAGLATRIAATDADPAPRPAADLVGPEVDWPSRRQASAEAGRDDALLPSIDNIHLAAAVPPNGLGQAASPPDAGFEPDQPAPPPAPAPAVSAAEPEPATEAGPATEAEAEIAGATPAEVEAEAEAENDAAASADIAALIEQLNQEADAGDGNAAPADIASIVPRSRPDGLVPEAEQGEAGAEAETETEAGPSEFALLSTTPPRSRPSDLARRLAAAPPPAATIAPPATAAPPAAEPQRRQLPTAASVQQAATISNAIDTRNLALIGVYGRSRERRALLRLPNGRYIRAQVGDTVQGYQIAVIGNDAIRIRRNGRDRILVIPK